MAAPAKTGLGAKGPAGRGAALAEPAVEAAARFGYGIKGVVYIIIGLLALQVAFSSGGRTTDSRGAMAAVQRGPFGTFLLVVVGLGLAAYAAWRFVEATCTTGGVRAGQKRPARRVAHATSGLGYGLLAFTALRMALGGAGRGRDGAQDSTARLLQMPFGPLLVGLVGIFIAGMGIAQIMKGCRGAFEKDLDFSRVPTSQRGWIRALGRLGYVSRGAVFAIIGGFFVQAGMHADAHRAKGLGSALDLLLHEPLGRFLLTAAAAGLCAYGMFMMAEAKYRLLTVDLPQPKRDGSAK